MRSLVETIEVLPAVELLVNAYKELNLDPIPVLREDGVPTEWLTFSLPTRGKVIVSLKLN